MKAKRTLMLLHGGAPISVEVDVLDLTDIPAALTACRDPEANLKAMNLCRKIADGRVKGMPFAIYVIHALGMPVCKIGVASNPAQRLLELQVGNWNDLAVAALIWTDSAPMVIEQTAHRAAKQIGINLRGEWLAAEPDEACELALKAARHHKAAVYDSATWIENWGTRMQAVAEAKGRLSAIEKLRPRGNLGD